MLVFMFYVTLIAAAFFLMGLGEKLYERKFK